MNLALAIPVFTARTVLDWLRTLGLALAPVATLATRQRRSVYGIDKNAFVKIAHPYGATINCVTGSVWVTLDNDLRDVVLSTGQSSRVDSSQRVIVQALDAARVRINTAA